MLYFHANGEDISLSRDLLTKIRKDLNINILAVEYPKYGLYSETDDLTKTIEEDAV